MHAPKHVMLVNTFFIISFFLSLSLHVSTACLDAFFRGLFGSTTTTTTKYPQTRPPSQGRHFHGPNEVISISNSTVKKRSNFYFDLLARQWQRCLRFRYTFFTRLSRFKCTFSGCGLFFEKVASANERKKNARDSTQTDYALTLFGGRGKFECHAGGDVRWPNAVKANGLGTTGWPRRRGWIARRLQGEAWAV